MFLPKAKITFFALYLILTSGKVYTSTQLNKNYQIINCILAENREI